MTLGFVSRNTQRNIQIFFQWMNEVTDIFKVTSSQFMCQKQLLIPFRLYFTFRLITKTFHRSIHITLQLRSSYVSLQIVKFYQYHYNTQSIFIISTNIISRFILCQLQRPRHLLYLWKK